MKEQGGTLGVNDDIGEVIGVTAPVRINSLRYESAPVRINSLRYESAPVCYVLYPKGYLSLGYTYIRFKDGFVREDVCRKINNILNELEPNYPFEIKFYDMISDNLYASEIRQGKIISLFSILAAMLSLIGVFGQVLLDVQFRRHEVAVRKVYGADKLSLIRNGLNRYFGIVGSAFIIAAPIAWLLSADGLRILQKLQVFQYGFSL